MLKQQSNVTTLIGAFFAQFKVLLGKPQFKWMSHKTVVLIPYFVPKSISLLGERSSPAGSGNPILLTDKKVNSLGSAIAYVVNFAGKENHVVEVRFIRLRYPYLDSSILTQYLAMNAGKYSFIRMQKGIFNKVPTISMNKVLPIDALPSQLTGVKLEVAGRLTTQRSIPRKTVNNSHIGSFTVGRFAAEQDLKVISSLDFGQYASKNKLGSFTVKVWLSQKA